MVMYLVALLFVTSIYIIYSILWKNKNYWKERNVPYIKPLPIFGNYKDALLSKKHMMMVAHEICQKFPNEPYVGIFFGTDPALLVKDPNLLKVVLTKDFNMCNGREISDHSHREITTRNMFFTAGDYWKIPRMNLTPLFSSSKLKNMFYMIKDCADTLERLLEDEVKTNSEPDKRKLMVRYTMDCIGTCAFGIKTGTMESKDKQNVFTSIGDDLFEVTKYRTFRNLARVMWPKTFYALGLTMFPVQVGTFFTSLLTDIIRSREATNSTKNDFVDLILTWKKKKFITGDSIENFRNKEKKTISIDVTDELLVAQCTLFFGAGFETTATSMSFLLYNLAKHLDIQDKVIAEVDDYFNKNDEMEFECINSLPYIEACIEENLRIYPIAGIITREVMYDYTLPTGLHLKKGSRIHVPVYYLHHNADYFPEPETFRPERFLGEERKNIKPYTYMPFGEGPRICIGMRFSKMPVYAAILKIFKNYRLELTDDMPRTIDFDPKSLPTQSIHGIRLKFIPREK